jgi:hypothetical protein
MNLNANKFENISRVVSGTVILFPNDSVLLCDTSSAAVNMTLLSIPANYWQTTWKLYIQDNSNNAGTNNITINAGSGQTINGSSSITINTNSGGAIVQIASNTSFAALPYPISGGGGTPVAASEDSTTVVSDCTNFSFDGKFFDVTNPSANKALISLIDSGWVDLVGFEFYPSSQPKPKVRRVGNALYFKGVLVIPIQNGSNAFVPFTTSGAGAFYSATLFSTPFSGSSPYSGVIVNTAGSITFNLGSSVLPPSLNLPSTPLDDTYQTGWGIYHRTVQTSLDATSGVTLSSIFNIFIASNGTLVIQTYRDIEEANSLPATTLGVGLGTARPIISNVKNNNYVPNYTAMDIIIEFTLNVAYNASIGAIYTAGTPASSAFRVLESISAGLKLVCACSVKPFASGALTKLSGTGDATINYSSFSVISENSTTHSSSVITDFDIDYKLSTYNNRFQFDVDAAEADKIGGFLLRLDGLTAFVNT